MTPRLRNLPLPVPTPGAPTLSVCILYDDLAACLRAKAFLDCALSPMDSAQELNLEFLRCDLLPERSPDSRGANGERFSSIVILTAQRDSLSPTVEDWLGDWLQSRRKQHSALVLLLEEANPSPDQDGMVSRLRLKAERNGADFLCEFFEWEPPVANAGVQAPQLPDIRSASALWMTENFIEGVAPPGHWGINE